MVWYRVGSLTWLRNGASLLSVVILAVVLHGKKLSQRVMYCAIHSDEGERWRI